jgi:hypothetical protein
MGLSSGDPHSGALKLSQPSDRVRLSGGAPPRSSLLNRGSDGDQDYRDDERPPRESNWTLQKGRPSERTRVHARTRPGIAVRQPRFTARLEVPAKWAESNQAGDPFTNREPVRRCTRFVPETGAQGCLHRRKTLQMSRKPTPGLEPGTPSLRVKCSTSLLRWRRSATSTSRRGRSEYRTLPVLFCPYIHAERLGLATTAPAQERGRGCVPQTRAWAI